LNGAEEVLQVDQSESTEQIGETVRGQNPILARLRESQPARGFDCEVRERDAVVAGLATDSLTKPVARQFSDSFKLQVLAEVEALPRGQVGEYLRKMGLYSSTLAKWRTARENGTLTAIAEARTRPKRKELAALRKELEQTQKQLAAAEKRARNAEVLLDAQKKILSLYDD
jgi:transposase